MIETYSLNIFKCKLCEEVILAEHKSSTCPFCGSHDDYIIRAQDWSNEDKPQELSKNTRENLEKAYEFELESARFYKCAASHAQNQDMKNLFQSLSKVEMQHVMILSRLLRKPSLSPTVQDICFRLDGENVKDSFDRETKLKEFYRRAYNQAIEPQIKEILFGLIEAEGDHIELLKEKM